MFILKKLNKKMLEDLIKDKNIWILLFVIGLFNCIMLTQLKKKWVSFFLLLILSISILFVFDFKKYNINYRAFLLLSLIMFFTATFQENLFIQQTKQWEYKDIFKPLRLNVPLFLFPAWIIISFIIIVTYSILLKYFV